MPSDAKITSVLIGTRIFKIVFEKRIWKETERGRKTTYEKYAKPAKSRHPPLPFALQVAWSLGPSVLSNKS